MKIKFPLANISLQIMIFVMAVFTVLTQTGSMRQPVKLFMKIILVLSLLSLLINIYNYVKAEKE